MGPTVVYDNMIVEIYHISSKVQYGTVQVVVVVETKH